MLVLQRLDEPKCLTESGTPCSGPSAAWRFRDALHNSLQMGVVQVGMSCKADFAGRSPKPALSRIAWRYAELPSALAHDFDRGYLSGGDGVGQIGGCGEGVVHGGFGTLGEDLLAAC